MTSSSVAHEAAGGRITFVLVQVFRTLFVSVHNNVLCKAREMSV